MYGYIYKTTNKLNGKIYVGQHKGTFTLKYLGSGKLLKRAINKYGTKNFYVEFIDYCETFEEANNKEKYWINKLNSLFPNGYNIANGGWGGDIFNTLSEKQKKDVLLRISKSLKGRKFSPETLLSRKIKCEKYVLNGTYKKTLEQKRRISQAIKGRLFVNNGNEQHQINRDNLKEYLDKGYVLGMLCRKNSKEWKEKLSKSNIGKKQSKEIVEKRNNTIKLRYPDGYKRLPDNYVAWNKGQYGVYCWVTNDIDNKYILCSDLQKYLKQGYRKGRNKNV